MMVIGMVVGAGVGLSICILSGVLGLVCCCGGVVVPCGCFPLLVEEENEPCPCAASA